MLSVGRVQTPLLGLIVARDRAIASFRPVPYFVVAAQMETASGERFPGRLVARASGGGGSRRAPSVAGGGRGRAACATGKKDSAVECREDKKTEPPPLPYTLADLQMDAGRRARMSASEVLGACQSLYESHRLLTYPRSDCAYLPEGHRTGAP